MRLLSLLVVVSVTLCYSGICTAMISAANGPKEISTYCHTDNHSKVDNSDDSQLFIQNASTADLQHFHCCSEILTNSSVEDSLDKNLLAVQYLLDFPSYLDAINPKNIALIITRSYHDPPDIYLSVSSFLL